MNHSNDDLANHEFLGLEAVSKEAAMNTSNNGESIYPVANEVFSNACNQGVEFWRDDFIAEISEMCDALRLKFVRGGIMDTIIKAQMVNTIANGEFPLGRRYEKSTIVHAISRTLIQYEPYRSIAERM